MAKRIDARHRSLTEEAMTLFLEQLDLRMAILSYDELAQKTGMTRNSARVTMWNLMHERRAGTTRVHRGIAKRQAVDEAIAELTATDASTQ